MRRTIAPLALAARRRQALGEQVEQVAAHDSQIVGGESLLADDQREQHQSNALRAVGEVHASAPSGCYSLSQRDKPRPLLIGKETRLARVNDDFWGFNLGLVRVALILGSWAIAIGLFRLAEFVWRAI